MITIDIDPILISLGPLSLSWHSLFMAIAIGIGVWLPARLIARAGLPVDRLYSLVLWGVPGGIIGARLVHVIDYWSHYDGSPLLPNSVTHAWIKLVRRCGLNGIRLHDTRHTHASLLLKQGVHPKIVQERLGSWLYSDNP